LRTGGSSARAAIPGAIASRAASGRWAGEPKSPVDDGKPPAEPRYRKFGVVYVQVRRRCPRCGADRYHWIAHGVAQCECGHTWRFRMRDPLAVRDRTVKVIV